MSSPNLTRHALPVALWFLAALVLYLLGNGHHSLWDRDETRYATASHQMLQSGDWVVPHFNDQIRFDKPVLIYWLQSAPMRLFGAGELAARMPAAVAGAGAIALIYLLALALGAGVAGATVAALMALLCPLLLIVFKASTTDGVLTFSIVAMMFLHWRQRQLGFAWWRHLLFYTILAASILLKGPLGVMVTGLAIAMDEIWRNWPVRPAEPVRPEWWLNGLNAILSWFVSLETSLRRIDWPRRFKLWAAGWAVVLALGLPWVILVQQRTGGEFLRVAIGHHVIDRAFKPLEGHKGPFVYYLPVLLCGVFPWSALLILGLRHAWRRVTPETRFLWCWLVPGFIVFSLVSTKLPHYIAPLLPAVALMGGLWWADWQAGIDPPGPSRWNLGLIMITLPEWLWWRVGAVLTGVLGGAVGVGLVVAMGRLGLPALTFAASLIGFVLAASSIYGAREWWLVQPIRALYGWSAGMLLACVLLMTWLLPTMEPLRPSKPVTAWVRDHAPAGTRLLAADYTEPSLVFYWGGLVDFIGNSKPDEALKLLADLAHPTALITTEKRWRRWQERLPAIATIGAKIQFQHKYYVFQQGKWVELVVVGNW